MNVEVVSNVDTERLTRNVEGNKAFWTFSANEWHRLIESYTPMRTGNLYRNVTISPGEIKYNAPYSVRVYYGDHMRFRKDLHPKATARWDEAARPEQEDKLIASMQGYIDSGRLDLYG